MNFWQLGVLALLALIAWGVFHGVRQLSTISRQLSRQLSNLFMLTAAAHKFPLSSELADESCNGSVVGHTGHLKHWENKTYHRFLADGMTPDDALSASNALRNSQARWIAENASRRIENGCHNATDSNLCPTCAQNFAAAEATWAKLMEQEKVSGKSLDGFEYCISPPPCPTPVDKVIADTDRFIAECGTKPEQKKNGEQESCPERYPRLITVVKSLF
jgi:hypothetical protein